VITMKPNTDIRNLFRVSGFCTWQVAKILGMHENSLYRLLRKELGEQEKKQIFQALEKLEEKRDVALSKMNQSIEDEIN
jgi:hypothetical protein